MTYQAIWNGAVIAESDATVMVEGNHYFPADAVRAELLRESATHTTCGWKGVASYYSLEVGGQVNRDAAWYYPEPKAAAAQIRGHVAFWRGVQVRAVAAQPTAGQSVAGQTVAGQSVAGRPIAQAAIITDEACEIDDLTGAPAH